MDDNPYSPPATDPAPRFDSAKADEIRAIAAGQKWLLVCCAAHVVIYLLVPTEWSPEQQFARTAVLWGLLAILAASFAVSLYLAPRVFYPALGYAIAIVTLFPCGGLFALLIISRRASSKLEEIGIEVGYLGSDSEQVERRLTDLCRAGKIRGEEK